MPLGDPFDFSGSAPDANAPGLLGQSPNWWQHMAMLGANVANAANARTADGHLANGTGFLGPFSAGFATTMQQGQTQALAQAQMRNQNAEATTRQLQNTLTALGIPVAQAQAQMQYRALTDPAYRDSLLGGGPPAGPAGGGLTPSAGPGGITMPSPSAPAAAPFTAMPASAPAGPTPSAAPPPAQTTNAAVPLPAASPPPPGVYPPGQGDNSYATAINKHEGMGQNPRSTAFGAGQFLNSTWLQFAKENPQYFQNMDQNTVLAQRANPQLGIVATNWLASKFAPVLQQYGVAPTGQSLGLAHYLGPKAAAGVMQAQDNVPVSAVLEQQLGPATARQFITANPELGTLTSGALKGRYGGTATPGPYQAPPASQFTPVGVPAPALPPAPTTTVEAPPAAAPAPAAPAVLAGLNARLPTAEPPPGPGTADTNQPVPMPAAPAPAPASLTSARPFAPGPAGPAPASAPQPPAAPPMLQGSPQATALAAQYEAQAAELNRRAQAGDLLKMPGLTGDPTVLRQQALSYTNAAIALRQAGPEAFAKAAGAAPFNMNRINAGGILMSSDGRIIGSAPVRSDEIITSGPNAGMRVSVLRSPIDGSIVGTQSPGPGAQPPPGGNAENTGLPPGSIPTHLPPQQEGRLKGAGEVETHDLTQDRKVVEEDLAHVIENVGPAKQQLFQLRALADNPATATGAASEFRSTFKNWVQTFAPDFVSQITGDASPAQEFKKIALMGAGKQERGDLGARGGFRAIELYLHANPSLENQPTANHDMANALLISHQYHEDYATGAANWYNQNREGFIGPNHTTYNPIAKYDPVFMSRFRPELYAAAISAMNGHPYAEWSKGLTRPQMQIVGGILQRADPNAHVDLNGQQVPVSAFRQTIGPTNITGPGNGL